MAIQDFTAGQVLTAAQMDSLQANDYNQTVSTKTANYVLVAADKGTRVAMNAAGATTITVNTSVFNAGDTLFIQNIGAGTCTVTAGTATVTTASSLALAQWGGGTLYFTSASAAIFFSGGGVSYGTATGGSSSSITVGGINYSLLTFTSDGNLVVSKAGLFDVLLIGGGGSGGSGQGSVDSVGAGGGGGEVVGINSIVTLYLAAATYALDVGAGGAGVVHANIGNSGAYSKIADLIYALGGGSGGGISASNNVVYAIGRWGYPGGNNGGSTITDDYTYVRRALSPNSYLGGIGTQLVTGSTSDTPTAGGAGANQAGGDASGSTGGAGGNGKDISPFIGGSTYYAGAGAGGCGATAGAAGNGGVAGVTGTTPNNGVNYGAAGSGVRGGPSTSGSGAAGAIFVRFKV